MIIIKKFKPLLIIKKKFFQTNLNIQSLFFTLQHRNFFILVDEKGVWSDYSRSWNDTAKSFCMTSSLYTDAGSQAATLTPFFPQNNTEMSTKDGFDVRSGEVCCQERHPDNHYEDPDGLRLVSFTERSEQRYSIMFVILYDFIKP